MIYYYGKTIKEYRVAKGMTLAQLAYEWPSKESGVNIRYVQDIEAGKKQVTNISVLRKIAFILEIPLFKFGLSEYDPFDEENSKVYNDFDLNFIKETIEDIWYIRINMPIEIVEKKINHLSSVFDKIISNNKNILNNKDFLILYANLKRLQEVIYTEKHNYTMSLKCSYEMLNLSKKSGDIKSECLALTRIGVELLRGKNKDAIDILEDARDLSFRTGSKDIGAYCYSFLARGYVTFNDSKRFNKSIESAIAVASDMIGIPISTKDYVFHAYSAILEEKSNGLILLGRGKEALKELEIIEEEVKKEKNTYLNMWLPLDYAQCFMLMKEVETSIEYLEVFCNNALSYKSQRMIEPVKKYLEDLDKLGYKDLRVVKDFRSRHLEKYNLLF